MLTEFWWCIITAILTLLVQRDIYISALILPPLGLTTEVEQKDVFWQEGDPQLCVLVSTYIGHGLRLSTLISSLLATEYPYIDIFLLDTDMKRDSLQWLRSTKAIFNARWDAGNTQRSQVHISARTRKTVRDLHPLISENDYGYLLSDYVIKDLNEGKVPNAPKCDYYMLTNGDNMYNIRLVPEALPYMREKIGLIGFEFNTRYPMDNTLVRHRLVTNQQVNTQFQTGSIDKGAAMFHAEATKHMSFALRFIQPAAWNFTRRSDSLDGYFFEDLYRTPLVRSVVLPQELFIHQ